MTVSEMYELVGTFCCGSSESKCGAYEAYEDDDGRPNCMNDCDFTVESSDNSKGWTMAFCTSNCYSDCRGECLDSPSLLSCFQVSRRPDSISHAFILHCSV